MRLLATTPLRDILLGLVTLALLSLPFAHRTGAAPVTAEMTDYLALGGDIADLCGDSGTAPAGGCESCRISASMHLILPEPAWRAAQLSAVVRLSHNRQTPHAAAITASPHAARAPPLV